jgi:outer membrane receptor protein involved in Fe transport
MYLQYRSGCHSWLEAHWVRMPSMLAGTLLALALPSRPAAADEDAGTRSPVALEEVVVTASKRTEDLSKVGGAVSVVSGVQLEERSANSLQDYIASIPGVTLQSFGTPGFGVVSIRGIAAQSVGAATATYIDEVPFGPSSALTEGALFTLDMNPEDLERVEVLKGPQGTLYGASSMGGLIKYVTRAPDLENVEIRASEDFRATENGGPGVKVSAAASAPLIQDMLAVRMSAYYLHDGGYIDDLGVGGKDTNRSNNRGFRGSLLYKPLDNLTVRLSATSQDSAVHGQNVVDYDLATGRPVNGDLTQYRYMSEPFTVQMRLYSAEVNYDMGKVSLVSATSYSSLNPESKSDDTAIYAALGLPFATPQTPLGSTSVFPTSQVTQELRLVSQRMGITEWMLGGFYQHESLHDDVTLTQYDGPNGLPNTNLSLEDSYRTGTLTEYAAFANATVYLAPSFDITGGFRDSHISQTRTRGVNGLLGNPTEPGQYAVTYQAFSENSNTYLAAARWRVTDDVLLYARAASGYRPGGGRSVPIGAPPGFPDTYTSDSLWSYESGVKLRELEGRLTIDADAFWINWKNIQTLQPVAGKTVDGNAGTAISRGIELQTEYIPFRGLTVGGNAAFTDAHFTQSVPGIGVTDGERLYYVPRWTAEAHSDYSHSIGGGLSGFVGAEYQYQSLRYDVLRTPLPGYGVFNLHTGINNDHYRVNLYVNNVTNKIGLVGYSNGGFGAPYGFAISPPRVFGVTFSEKF